ncbi:unnamed protein product, partial [Ectocarpus sp. 13 AM-2016]
MRRKGWRRPRLCHGRIGQAPRRHASLTSFCRRIHQEHSYHGGVFQVERELRSHLRFLKSNHYAALQLPLSWRASADRTSRSAGISDALVKSNYRRLALRFHPGWWCLRLVHLLLGFTTVAVHHENDQGELFAA